MLDRQCGDGLACYFIHKLVQLGQHGHKLVLNIRGSQWIESSAYLTNVQTMRIQLKCGGIDLERK